MKKTMLALVALASLSSCGVNLSYEQMSDDEKAMFVAVEDLNRLGLGYAIDSKKADCTGTSVNIPFTKIAVYRSYKYLISGDDAGSPGRSVFISNSIDYTIGFRTGISEFIADKSVEFVLKQSGIVMKELSGFKKFTPDYRFYLLSRDGSPVGNYVRYTAGSTACSVLMTSVYFDSPQSWDSFYQQKYDQIVRLTNN
jgi:hypothetical protein